MKVFWERGDVMGVWNKGLMLHTLIRFRVDSAIGIGRRRLSLFVTSPPACPYSIL